MKGKFECGEVLPLFDRKKETCGSYLDKVKKGNLGKLGTAADHDQATLRTDSNNLNALAVVVLRKQMIDRFDDGLPPILSDTLQLLQRALGQC